MSACLYSNTAIFKEHNDNPNLSVSESSIIDSRILEIISEVEYFGNRQNDFLSPILHVNYASWLRKTCQHA